MLNIYCIDQIIEFNTNKQTLASYLLYMRKSLEFFHEVSAYLGSIACKIAIQKLIDLCKSCSTAYRMSAECRTVRTCRESLCNFCLSADRTYRHTAAQCLCH